MCLTCGVLETHSLLGMDLRVQLGLYRGHRAGPLVRGWRGCSRGDGVLIRPPLGRVCRSSSRSPGAASSMTGPCAESRFAYAGKAERTVHLNLGILKATHLPNSCTASTRTAPGLTRNGRSSEVKLAN